MKSTKNQATRTPQVERALREAQERRAARERARDTRQPEIDGPKGLDPARYGDWEKDGITSDF